MNLRELIFGRRFELASPFTRDECVKRLQEQTGSPWFPWSKKAVIGIARKSSLRIWQNHFYGNGFQTILYASIYENNTGTLLDCRTGTSRLAISWILIWFSAVLVLSLKFSWTGEVQKIHELFPYMGLNAIMFLIVVVSRFIARNEERFLIEFLEATIDAKRV